MIRNPLRALPESYIEIEYLNVTEDMKRLVWLNLMSVVPLAVAAVITLEWFLATAPLRAGIPYSGVPWWGVLLGIVALLVLHEALHGVAMLLLGHKPTFGAKLSQGLLYALSDGAYYRRDEFLFIALLPLVAITVAAYALMLVVSDGIAAWLGVAVVINASSAIGDLWMAARALRYPRTALVRDEPTGIRFFMPVA